MKCLKCGAELPEGKLYCEKCGEDVHIVPDFDPEVESQIDETMTFIMDEIDEAVPKGLHKSKRHRFFILLGVVIFIGICVSVYALWYLFTSAEYQLNRGNYFAQNADYHKAIEYYEKAYVLDEENIHLCWRIAECYNNLNDFEHYEAWLFRIVNSQYSLEKDVESAYNRLISLYAEKNDYQTIDSLVKGCNNVNVMEKYSQFLVAEPIFSHEAGLYKEIIPLKITCEEDETVYYTMDNITPVGYRTQGFTLDNGAAAEKQEGYVSAEARTPFDDILFGEFDAFLRMLGLKELLSMFYTIIYCIATSLSIF